MEIEDVAESTAEYADIEIKNISRLDAIGKMRTEPDIPTGTQCTQPYDCWYCAHCVSTCQ